MMTHHRLAGLAFFLLLLHISKSNEAPGGGPSAVARLLAEGPSFSYLGCFADCAPGERDLPVLALRSRRMTAQACAEACAAFNFRYFGTQRGSECRCGNAFGRQGPSANCTAPCAAIPSEHFGGRSQPTATCGGVCANSVYQLNGLEAAGPPTPHPTVRPKTRNDELVLAPFLPYTGAPYEPVGCERDCCGKRRDMAVFAFRSDNLTTAMCASACAHFAFFATQDASECRCGHNHGSQGGSIECAYACAGDASEVCGGYCATSVYRYRRPPKAVAEPQTTNRILPARVAVVVPVHEPNFGYGERLLLTHYDYSMNLTTDLHFVMTSNTDARQFLEHLAASCVHLDTAESSVHVTTYGGNQGLLAAHPSFFKKWWMVEQLVDSYEYLIAMDADAEFVKHSDLYAVTQAIVARKLFFGVEGCREGPQAKSMWRFSPQDVDTLKSKTSDGQLDLLWNELPVLESASAKRFLREYQVTTTPTSKGDYDFLPYAYFLMLREGWNAVDLTATLVGSELDSSERGGGCLHESVGASGGGSADTVRYSQPHWAHHAAFTHAPARFADTDIVMTFSHGRPINRSWSRTKERREA
jgi:hypothetical protein